MGCVAPAGADLRGGVATETLPSVTSTSTALFPKSTEKAVPTARTSTPPAATTKGRAGFFATLKYASPLRKMTRRWPSVNATVISAPSRNSATEPSGSHWIDGSRTTAETAADDLQSGGGRLACQPRPAPTSRTSDATPSATVRRWRRCRARNASWPSTASAAPFASGRSKVFHAKSRPSAAVRCAGAASSHAV